MKAYMTDGFALVVGAASGIGLETALTFAEHGARGVAFADQNLEGAQAAATRSKSVAISPDYVAIAVHVQTQTRESVKRMLAEVHSQFGRIDYAVNSAGESEYDHLHDVNCKGILHCLQEEINVMKQQESRTIEGRSGPRSVGPGAIVNITSVSSLVGQARSVTYTASKFAARGVIKCAALETRSLGLRINEVCPSFTKTPMLQRALDNPDRDSGLGNIIQKYVPLGRAAYTEEVASVAHFLTCPATSYVTGQSWVVDCGITLSGVIM